MVSEQGLKLGLSWCMCGARGLGRKGVGQARGGARRGWVDRVGQEGVGAERGWGKGALRPSLPNESLC